MNMKGRDLVEHFNSRTSPRLEDAVQSFKPVEGVPDQMARVLARVDYPAYLAKVGEIANRLCLARMDQALKLTGATRLPTRQRAASEPDAQARLYLRQTRKARRAGQQARTLSTAGKAHIDLQIKMLGAIPPQARAEFLDELADHARRFPPSGGYIHNLAAKGDATAQEIVARMGAE
jgi:hypothetical protein